MKCNLYVMFDIPSTNVLLMSAIGNVNNVEHRPTDLLDLMRSTASFSRQVALRNAMCPSVVSFNSVIPRAQSLIIVIV